MRQRALVPALAGVLCGVILAFQAHPTAAQEGWRGARSEHYVLAGSADEDEIREVAARLEGFRAVVLRLFTGARYRALPPTTVLVLDDEDELRPFDLDDEGDGYFFAGPLDNYIVLVPESRRRKPFPAIFHDYFHAIAAENLPNAPLWLVEGLAEYYSTVEWSSEGTHVLMGNPINSHIRIARDEDKRLSFEAPVRGRSKFARIRGDGPEPNVLRPVLGFRSFSHDPRRRTGRAERRPFRTSDGVRYFV